MSLAITRVATGRGSAPSRVRASHRRLAVPTAPQSAGSAGPRVADELARTTCCLYCGKDPQTHDDGHLAMWIREQ